MILFLVLVILVLVKKDIQEYFVKIVCILIYKIMVLQVLVQLQIQHVLYIIKHIFIVNVKRIKYN